MNTDRSPFFVAFEFPRVTKPFSYGYDKSAAVCEDRLQR